MSGNSGKGRIQIEAPSVTKHISRTLERYPDGGQILKELIQNADDAGATEIKFCLDTRHHSKDDLIHPNMGIFQGPALLTYNNAVFKEDDWKHFGKMEDSSKEKEALKVGRFGVGFLSVFHITDLPTVISTDIAALLDPHQRYTGTNRMGWDDDLKTFFKYTGHASCFDGLFGLARSTKYFNGTLFRFPLRTPESNSEIANAPYPVERIHGFLYESFIKEAPIIMLFLKYIEKISLYINDRLVYEVSINPSHVSLVRQERKALIDLATKRSLSCSLRVYSMSIAIDDYRSGEHDSNQYHWLLMNSIGSTDCDIIQMSQKQQNIPWVGIAASLPHSINLSQLVLSSCDIANIASCVQPLQKKLSRSCISLQWHNIAQSQLENNGQVFCFLPLPNTTHLPVNIHGYFAVSDNRRTIEWPAGDNDSVKAQWNRALLHTHIAPLYSILIACRTQLVTYTGTPLPLSSSEGDVTDPYIAWPLSSNVQCQLIWNELLQPVIDGIANAPILWTPARNGTWIKLNEAYYLPMESTIPNIAIEVLIKANFNVVSLPHKIRETLNECSYKSLIQQCTIDPSLVRQALKVLPDLVFDNKVVENLLEYILSDINHSNCLELIGIKLLPLKQVTLAADYNFKLSHFMQNSINSKNYVFVGNSQYVTEALEFLPGTEDSFVDTDLSQSILFKLQKLAQWQRLQLRIISPKFIANVLLFKSICSWNRWFSTHNSLQWTPGQGGHPSNDWITKVWTWINRNPNIISLLVGLPLLPKQELLNSPENITLLPLVDNASYFVTKDSDEELADIIHKLGATVVAYNTIVFEHSCIWSYVQQINIHTVLQYISSNKLVNLSQLSNEDKGVLRIAIASYYNIRGISFVNLIKRLPIFEVGMGANPIQLVPLNSSVHVLPHQHTKFDSAIYYPPNIILSNREPVVVQLMKKLGFNCLSNDELFLSHILPFALQECRSSSRWCNGDDLIVWMLASRLSQKLVNALKNESFIRTRANEAVCRKASQLYDINDEQFEKLFNASSDPVFPSDIYSQKGVTFNSIGLITWKALLKNPSQLVCFIKERAESIQHVSGKYAMQRSQYIIELISANRTHISPVMSALKDTSFLAVQRHPPQSYPAILPWAGGRARQFEAPRNICSNKVDPFLIGSVLPIVAEDYFLPLQMLYYFKSPGLNDVLKQFQLLVSKIKTPLKDENAVAKVTEVVHCVYKYLNNSHSQVDPSQLPCLWIWWSKKRDQKVFMPLSKFVWNSEISLSPIVYSLTTDPNIACYKELFERAGVRQSLTLPELAKILKTMASEKVSDHYLKMAIGIVKHLEDSNFESSGEVYLPTTDDQLCLAKHCTYDDREWIRQRVGTGISKHKFVHGDIPPKTARYFGVEPLSKKVAPSKRLGLKYTQTGPKESITRRISGIVNDYSGNIDVFKELIQNADDAGASEIKLLIDWRKHGTEYLFENTMECWQGPAIVAYNNATFTDQDFENICELAAETKMKDPLKTGRFGVGFCSCYSLTDVPSFVSRHLMTIFDPHTKYLGERVSHNEPGIRIDLIENKDDLLVYEHQFAPFNGLFGCNIFNLDEDGFNGTIFRFPLRMSGCPGSEISHKIYEHNSINFLVEGLKKEGDNLITFLKNVKSFQLLILQNSATDASEMKMIFEVKKQSEQNHLSRIQLIKNPDVHFPPVCSTFSVNVIDTEKSVDSTTQYLMSSSLCEYANVRPGLIPLAEIAIKLTNTAPDLNIDGRLFCFLPLPLKSNLPFHINGFFDVGKDRRGLKEAHKSPEYQWNKTLIRSALPSALVAAFSSICKKMTPALKTDQKESYLKNYYSLWPTISFRHENWISKEFSHQMKHILCQSHEKLLWSEVKGGTWVCSKEAFVYTKVYESLANDERKAILAKINEEAIQLLLSEGYQIVECPYDVNQLLKDNFNDERVFNYESFFKKVFLPKIASIDVTIRNNQLLFVLGKIHEELNSPYSKYKWAIQCLKNSKCIPVAACEKLELPGNLINVHSKHIANLYYSEEGHFPDEMLSQNESIMEVLAHLGMMKDVLPIPMLTERAESVSSLYLTDSLKAYERMVAILQYIWHIESHNVASYRMQYLQSMRIPGETNKRISALSNIPFIKFSSKPDSINLPWYSCNRRFLPPSEVFSSEYSTLVFTQRPLFQLPVTEDDMELNKMVVYLGIDKNEPSVQIVLDNLCCLIKYIEDKELDEVTLKYLENEKVFSSMYEFLDKHKRDENAIEMIKTKLEHTKCIWQNNKLLAPYQVLHHWNHKTFYPYLCGLSEKNLKFAEFFKTIGVSDEATMQYLVDILKSVEKNHSGIPLSDELLYFVNDILLVISQKMKDDEIEILLPNAEKILCPASALSCDSNLDTNWISKLKVYDKFSTQGSSFTHNSVPREMAKKLGAFPIIEAVMKELEIEDNEFLSGIDFGQHEDLVDRLNGILKKYPADTSIFREFIQNADDAQATEIVFVLDHRTNHPQETLLSHHNKWKELQTSPALCIFNNRPFSEADINGICQLGRGGKGDTADTIGRFGIGFNVAYHVTDCPSFVSFDDKGSPKDFCVFDPLRKYCPMSINKQRPGRRWMNKEHSLDSLPDQFEPYLINMFQQFNSIVPSCMSNQSKGFTVFRLPFCRWKPSSGPYSDHNIRWLREGRQHYSHKINELIMSFKKSSKTMLLFLNNIKHISVFEIQHNGKCFHHFTTDVTENESSYNKNSSTHLLTVESKIVYDSDKNGSEFRDESKCVWLVNKRLGLPSHLNTLHQAAKERGLEARGGTATQICPAESIKGTLFCFLPMNIPSCLPVHLNAHFLVEDSRNHLSKLPQLETWNDMIVEHIIIPSYIDLLLRARAELDGSAEKTNWYYNLFPNQLLSSEVTEASQLKVSELLFQYLLKQDDPILLDGRTKDTINWLKPQSCYFCLKHCVVDGTFVTVPNGLESMLLSLGMPITSAPAHLFSSFNILEHCALLAGFITPKKVVKFLKDVDLKNEKNLALIKKNCHLMLEFCLQNCPAKVVKTFLKDAPVLLSLGNTLESGTLINSAFADLFPHRPHKFIHPSLQNSSIIGIKLLESGVILKLSLNFVADNIDLPHVYEPTKLSETQVSSVKLLWKYFSNELFLQSQDILDKFSNIPIIPSADGYFYPPKLGKCLFQEGADPVSTVMKKLGYKQFDHSVISNLCHPIVLSLTSKANECRDVIKCIELCPPHISEQLSLTGVEVTYFIDFLSQNTIPAEIVLVLRKMPLFQTIDDSYISLKNSKHIYFMPSNVPTNGIIGIQSNITGHTVVKIPNRLVEIFYKKVIEKFDSAFIEDTNFYQNFIIPHFQKLNEDDLIVHLNYICSCVVSQSTASVEKWKDVIEDLKKIELILFKGKRRKVSEFYDPAVSFHNTFHSSKLPPKEWNTEVHLAFLRQLGLQRHVDKSMWLKNSKEVAAEGAKLISNEKPSEDLISRSEALITTLKEIIALFQKELKEDKSKVLKKDVIIFLDEASKMSFIYCPEDCQLVLSLKTIGTKLCNLDSSRFVKFQNSVNFSNANLAGISYSVLPSSCNFLQMFDKTFSEHLHICSLTVVTVIANLTKLSKALCSTAAQIVTIPSNDKLEAVKSLKAIFDEHYKFLEDKLNEDLAKQLINERCVLLSSNYSFLLVKPSQLVFHIPPEYDFAPFCYSVSKELMKFPKFLELLGIQKSISALQYIRILEYIKTEIERGKSELKQDPHFMKVCESAYIALIKHLRQLPDDEQPHFPKIFLPSIDKCLVESTELVHNDVPWIATRLQKSQKLKKKLLLPPPLDDKGQQIPPLCLKVKLLSEIAVEKLDDNVKQRINQCTEQELYETKKSSSNCQLLQSLEETLRSCEFKAGLARLYWHRNQKHPNGNKAFCSQLESLIKLKISCVKEIKTIIRYNNSDITDDDDSVQSCYLSKVDILTLYISHLKIDQFQPDEILKIEHLFECIALEFVKHLEHNVGDATNIKAILLCPPNSISKVLDQRKIAPFDPKVSITEVVGDQQIGSVIPLADIGLCEEDLIIMCNFEQGEKVIYHYLDSQQRPFFQYAKVLECHLEPGKSIALLKDKCVKLQTTIAQGVEKQVSLLQIYKLHNTSQRTTLKLTGQSSSRFFTPVALSSLPDSEEEIKKWLSDIISHNKKSKCCSMVHLSKRLIAHIKYVLLNIEHKDQLLPSITISLADMLKDQKDPDVQNFIEGLVCNKASLLPLSVSISPTNVLSVNVDNPPISVSNPPTIDPLVPPVVINSPAAINPPAVINPPAIISSPVPINPHNLPTFNSPSVINTPAPVISTPTFNPSQYIPHSMNRFNTGYNNLQSRFQGSRYIAGFHSGLRNLPISSRFIPPPPVPSGPQSHSQSNLIESEPTVTPPKPKTSLSNAEMWFQQAKADYLAAVDIFRGKDACQCNYRAELKVHDKDKKQDDSEEDKEEDEESTNTEIEHVDKEEVEEEMENEEDEDSDVVCPKPNSEESNDCKFPALVCFLGHDVVEKCLKGIMYAKCGLPTHLVESSHLMTLLEHMERSPQVGKEIVGVVRECVLQVNEHSNKSRYPNYQVPPCAPTSVYFPADASEVICTIHKFLTELKEDAELSVIIGEMEHLPEKLFRSPLMSTIFGSSSDNYPSFWDEQSTDVELVLLNPESDEYYRIYMLFTSTLVNCEVERIDRIQNKVLWQRYIDCARRMNNFNNGQLRELTLFHGSSTTEPSKIYEGDSSFNVNYSRDGYWGKGNYFAVNAKYSDSYAYACGHGIRQMLIANVLTGYSYYSPPQKFVEAPPRKTKDKASQRHYDSVHGIHPSGSKIYITYENDKAYPAYLITYKRH